jgi:uncharacterized protein (TIGR03790 family)
MRWPRIDVLRRALLLLTMLALHAHAEGLSPDRLGVIFNGDDPPSARVAGYYATRRHVPGINVIGLRVPDGASLTRAQLQALRTAMLERLPTSVQSLLLVWSRPYAVECMSITMAMAAGYQAGFCEPGCGPTTPSPLFDTPDWLPADTAGWLPAMLLPSDDEALARAVIDRGIMADGSRPDGTVYLVRTYDAARGVRASLYREFAARLSNRVSMRELRTPIEQPPVDIIGYFTGVARVEELSKLEFRPGAVADHLTSTGGALANPSQMSALEWLRQGATASYGTVSEPCNLLGKFPDPTVLFDHYVRGDTLLEAYWKSVAMPGQGLFIGEPLARPYPSQH